MRTTASGLSLHRRRLLGALTASPLAALGLRLHPPAILADGVRPQGNDQPAIWVWRTGEDEMPTVPVRWRIVTNTARPGGDAEFFRRTLHFLYNADGRAIRIRNRTANTSEVLTTTLGEEAVTFGREQDTQRRQSISTEPVPYLCWELIVADQFDTPETLGTAELIVATEPFTAPRGTQTMQFVSVVLDGDQRLRLPLLDHDAETIFSAFYVAEGRVRVSQHRHDAVTMLEAGDSGTIGPTGSIAAAGDESTLNRLLLVTFPDHQDLAITDA